MQPQNHLGPRSAPSWGAEPAHPGPGSFVWTHNNYQSLGGGQSNISTPNDIIMPGKVFLKRQRAKRK